MDEVVLSEEKELGAKLDNKTQVNKFLKERVSALELAVRRRSVRLTSPLRDKGGRVDKAGHS